MSFAKYALVTGSIALLVVAACHGAGDGPSDSSSFATGGGAYDPHICQEASDHVNGCLGVHGQVLPPAACTPDQACLAGCALAVPCDVIVAGPLSPGAGTYDACAERCVPPSTGAGPTGAGPTGGGPDEGTTSDSGGTPGGGPDGTSDGTATGTSDGNPGSTDNGGGDACPFSPGSISCDAACSHYMSYCTACGGCQFQTKDNCVADCDYELAHACDSVVEMWGCYASSGSCSSFDDCFTQTYCPQYPACF
ncbi:MAG TPA: hypothetical protein VHB21_24035 [Minicystis sp.]|nr:hypothetical protein [Minicystis sp.]